jgi:hypothetical protein
MNIPFENMSLKYVAIETELHVSSQGRAGGGLLPVCLTSFSVVMVVVPPGVLISVSVFVADFSPHPTMLSETRLSISAAQIMRFMGHVSY